MNEERIPAFWAVLPAKVRYDSELRPNAKLLYAEITSLADATGYCWAKNDYFAALYQLTIKTVSELISSLAKRNYLHVEVVRDLATNEVTERRIWVHWSEVDEGQQTLPKNRGRGVVRQQAVATLSVGEMDASYPKNRDRGIPKKADSSPPKNRDKNNINNINTNPHTPKGGKSRGEPRKAPVWMPERFAGFWNYYPRGEAKQDAITAWDKLKPSDGLIAIIGQALKRQKSTEEWRRGVGIPYASTWLNKRRWEDSDKLPVTDADEASWAADEERI